MAGSIVNIEKGSKSFQNKVLFSDAHFSIQEGEKVALIGRNGGGKSTLLRIIAGEEELDSGSIVRRRSLKISYLTQESHFPEEKSILEALVENFALRMGEQEREAFGKKVMQEIGLEDFYSPCKILSGGQKKQLALLAALNTEPDLLLLDEPTNHLDEEMAEWLEEKLKRFKGAVLLVSHDRYFLDTVCDVIVELEREGFTRYECSYSSYLERKAERFNIEKAQERARQSLLRKELAWVRRGAKARTTKQKGRLQRYEKLSQMHGPTEEEELSLASIFVRLGKSTINCENLTKRYGDKLLFSDFSYNFLRNDRIGIIGKNGAGKSTLMKAILGEIPVDEGKVEIGQTVRIAYFRQENEDLPEKERVIDSIKEIAEYLPTKEGLISASQMAERFLFSPEMQYAPIEKLSGGEKRRLYLLRILMSAPNVLFLDEPSNDLDLSSLIVLEDFLDSFPGIVFVISHDRYFLDRTVNRLFIFQENGQIRQFEGGYTDYQVQLLKEKEEAENVEKGSKAESKEDRGEEKSEGDKKKSWQGARLLKMSYQEKKDFEHIEEEIAKLEEELAFIEKESELNGRDYVYLAKLQEQKEEAEGKLLEKYERYEYLTELQKRIDAGEKV